MSDRLQWAECCSKQCGHSAVQCQNRCLAIVWCNTPPWPLCNPLPNFHITFYYSWIPQPSESNNTDKICSLAFLFLPVFVISFSRLSWCIMLLILYQRLSAVVWRRQTNKPDGLWETLMTYKWWNSHLEWVVSSFICSCSNCHNCCTVVVRHTVSQLVVQLFYLSLSVIYVITLWCIVFLIQIPRCPQKVFYIFTRT